MIRVKQRLSVAACILVFCEPCFSQIVLSDFISGHEDYTVTNNRIISSKTSGDVIVASNGNNLTHDSSFVITFQGSASNAGFAGNNKSAG